ncbi:MAG: TauD/TfdA family dioxygenase [Acidobacteria bacterium]|nr:TauD/TfdA family dioxygenase [Acidobacteriota bacterium]
MTALTIQSVSDDSQLGARVGGVTLEALKEPEAREQISDLFEERGLLIFEEVEPEPELQVAISTIIGPLKDHPSKATPRVGGDGMLGVIEIKVEPSEEGSVRIGDRELSAWLPWHFDHCYNDQLNRAAVLRAVESPAEGAMTGFVDGIALYDAVSSDARERIEGKMVLYAMDVIMENLRYGRPEGFVEINASGSAADVMAEYADRPRALHPAVWTRSTGEKVLHVSPWMAKGIEGLDDDAADVLLTEICDEIVEVSKGLSYFHKWKPTDMVIWDNWRVLHSVSGMAPNNARCMHRTTIAGDYGLGRFEETASAHT